METQLSPWNSNEKLPRAEKYELPNVCTIKKNADKATLQRTQFYLKLPLYCNWKHAFYVFENTEWKRIHCNLQLYIFKFNSYFVEKLPKPVRVLSFLFKIKDTVKTHD